MAAEVKRQVTASPKASMDASKSSLPEAEDTTYMGKFIHNELLSSSATSSSSTPSPQPASSKVQARTWLDNDDCIDDKVVPMAAENRMVHQDRRVDGAE